MDEVRLKMLYKRIDQFQPGLRNKPALRDHKGILDDAAIMLHRLWMGGEFVLRGHMVKDAQVTQGDVPLRTMLKEDRQGYPLEV